MYKYILTTYVHTHLYYACVKYMCFIECSYLWNVSMCMYKYMYILMPHFGDPCVLLNFDLSF